MSNTNTIPYNTWGGGGRSLSKTTTLSSSPQRVDNPYTISNLQVNYKVNTSIYDNSYVFNMANYAKNNISNYNTITSIPEEHSPNFINTSYAQDWYRSFNGCKHITSFNSFYNTDNAINMSFMFAYCNNLTAIPNFNTSNVTDMSCMFIQCYNLITTPNFDTSNVTDMNSMFWDCSTLTSIPNFNTSNVTDMSCMLRSCYDLTTVPNFDTSNVTDIGQMFDYCKSLTTVPNFDTSNVVAMFGMFINCKNLTTVPNFDTSNVTDMSLMFENCERLTTIPNFNTGKVLKFNGLFNNCRNLNTIPILNMTNANSLSYFNQTGLFASCVNIKGNLYIESNNVWNTKYLFANTPNYTKNIYCHINTKTYNNIYKAMGNNTYNSNWNTYLKTMENDYAEIPWTGNGIYRFPTNKIAMYFDWVDPVIIEVSPYTDYQLNMTSFDYGYNISHNGKVWYSFGDVPGFTTNSRFQFFKDITNMTANVVDII